MTEKALPAIIAAIAAAAAAAQIVAGQQPAPQTPPAPQQPSAISTAIGGPGAPASLLAVPEFLALSTDAETREAAKTLGAVLWDDLNYEREYRLISKDVVRTVPAATSMNDVPFARWRELTADEVVVGTVQRTARGLHVEVRVFNVQDRQSVFGQAYDGAVANSRWLAHTVADDIHWQRRRLHGVARTKLTFNSDRTNERLRGTIERRSVKDIYISDYDGDNQRRVVTNGTLNVTPAWSPDGRQIAYTSWRPMMQVVLSKIYEGTPPVQLTTGGENSLPTWSPDGRRLAFSSTRDGGNEIYTMNPDGSNLRRLTRNAYIDTSPAFSPNGRSIVFLSDRTGVPELYVMNADDGLNVQQLTHEGPVDRPSWSERNEIVYTKRNGSGYDIKILDMETRTTKQLTTGEGSNESPTFAPGGRHIAFTSTRAGREQIFTIARDGRDLRQLTTSGNNRQPSWSNGPRTDN